MKAIVDNLSPVKKKLWVEIDSKEVGKEVDKAYRVYGKTAKIKGFRPGKIPRKIMENYFGKQIVEQVTETLVRETLPKALEETKLLPVNMPVIENEILKTGQNYKYSAVMEVRPEFELEDYKGVEVEKEILSVTDDNVDKQLEEIRESNAKLKTIEEDRAVQEGDYVVIDYEAFDGKEPVDGVRAQNHSLIIGKKQFYPGIEEALTGSKKGDTLTVDVDFENSYFHSNLAGKKVTFKIDLKEIKSIELPELNNDFAKQLGGDIKGLDDLKEKVKEGLVAREEKRIDKEVKERLLSKISETVDFELPESLVENEINAGIESVRQNLMRTGSDFEKSGLDEAKLKEEFKPISESKVKGMLILGEIAKQNDFSVSEQEIAEGFAEISKDMGFTPDALRQYYETNNMMDSFKQTLLKEKTLNYLLENATVIQVDAEKLEKK